MIIRRIARQRCCPHYLPSLSSPSVTTTLNTRSFTSSPSGSSHQPHPSPSAKETNTISASEISHFTSLSSHWWNPTGEFSLLHRMNSSRIQFLRESLLLAAELPSTPPGKWLSGKSLLDVGSGGGIFAEALARLGGNVMGVDAAGVNVEVAREHASRDPGLKEDGLLEYRHAAAEDLVKEGKQFDVVCAMEVLEHVEDPRGFLECLMSLTKPGGHLLLSTISRTPLSHLITLTLAESVLKLVAPNTHTYSKFVKPEELQAFFDEKGWVGMERRGVVYDPIKGGWRLLDEGALWGLGEGVNYFAGVRRPEL